MPPREFVVRLFDRRELLKLGAAAAVLPACDTLSLPGYDTFIDIDPISSNDDFYVQSAFGTPELDAEAHEMVVSHKGEEIGRIRLDDLRGLAARQREHTLQCIGSRPGILFISNAIWSGLPLPEVLADLFGWVGPDDDVVEMAFVCADEYFTSIPATDYTQDEPLWLVWEMNGEPLPADHGAPFRFLVPARYGTKNPKWATSLDFSAEPSLGYWEGRDWSNTAEIQTNAFVFSPPRVGVVGVGRVQVVGTAFAGVVPIVRVEVQLDEGPWEEAVLEYTPADSVVTPDGQIWTVWSWEFQPTEIGDHTVRVKAESADGRTTTGVEGTDRKEGYDGGMEIVVKIR